MTARAGLGTREMVYIHAKVKENSTCEIKRLVKHEVPSMIVEMGVGISVSLLIRVL